MDTQTTLNIILISPLSFLCFFRHVQTNYIQDTQHFIRRSKLFTNMLKKKRFRRVNHNCKTKNRIRPPGR